MTFQQCYPQLYLVVTELFRDTPFRHLLTEECPQVLSLVKNVKLVANEHQDFTFTTVFAAQAVRHCIKATEKPRTM